MQTVLAFFVGVIIASVVGYALYRKLGTRRFDDDKKTNPFDVVETNASANLEYQFEFPPNPDCAGIHINRTLINSMIEAYDSPAQAETGGVFRTPAPEWVKKIFALPGIEKITLHNHEISFVKGRMYPWDDILPTAIEIMRQHFAPEMKAEQTKEPNRWHLDREGYKRDDFGITDDLPIQ
jgi:hypothetical protein